MLVQAWMGGRRHPHCCTRAVTAMELSLCEMQTLGEMLGVSTVRAPRTEELRATIRCAIAQRAKVAAAFRSEDDLGGSDARRLRTNTPQTVTRPQPRPRSIRGHVKSPADAVREQIAGVLAVGLRFAGGRPHSQLSSVHAPTVGGTFELAGHYGGFPYFKALDGTWARDYYLFRHAATHHWVLDCSLEHLLSTLPREATQIPSTSAEAASAPCIFSSSGLLPEGTCPWSCQGKTIVVTLSFLRDENAQKAHETELSAAKKTAGDAAAAAALAQLKGTHAVSLSGLAENPEHNQLLYRTGRRSLLSFLSSDHLTCLEFDKREREWVLYSHELSSSTRGRSPIATVTALSGLLPTGKNQWEAKPLPITVVTGLIDSPATAANMETELAYYRKQAKQEERQFRDILTSSTLNAAHYAAPSCVEEDELRQLVDWGDGVGSQETTKLHHEWVSRTRDVALVRSSITDSLRLLDSARKEAARAGSAARRILIHARTRMNDESQGLLLVLERDDLRHALFDRLSMVQLWRLRAVCTSLRRWCTAELGMLPQVIMIGGRELKRYPKSTDHVEALSMSTLKWTDCAVPKLDAPRADFAATCHADGRILLCGGRAGVETNDPQVELLAARDSRVLQWTPGCNCWEVLKSTFATDGVPESQQKTPEGSEPAPLGINPASTMLRDGCMFFAGGLILNPAMENDDNNENFVEDDSNTIATAAAYVLSVDGKVWTAVASMHRKRYGAVAGTLPNGHVIVAGGRAGLGDITLRHAELWDPEVDEWAQIDSMIYSRFMASACVLPSGCFAVFGGKTDMYDTECGYAVHHTCECFDPLTSLWTHLPAMCDSCGGQEKWSLYDSDMASRYRAASVAVAGGALVIGGVNPYDSQKRQITTILFDEAEGRWFALPDSWSVEGQIEMQEEDTLTTVSEDVAKQYEPQTARTCLAAVSVPARVAKVVEPHSGCRLLLPFAPKAEASELLPH